MSEPIPVPQGDSWPEILTALLAGRHLTRSSAAWAMAQVMEGNASPSQMAAFIVALRAKGEDAAEVGGLVETMLDHAVRITVTRPALDIVGTGGDQAHMVNISTMAAVVAAAAGARVVKHGNRAASSQCGSADVLEALGVAIDLGPAGVVECVDSLGIGFCFAPRFHPAMRHAAPTRREIGIPTVFNVLGPLANPASPAAALIGCADERLGSVMATVLAQSGQRTLVVRGADGIDEVTTHGVTQVWDATRGDESVVDGRIDAQALGIAVPDAAALRGGDAAYNARIARDVLSGSTEGTLAAVRDAVALNAATALVADSAARGEPITGDLNSRVAEHLVRSFDAMASGAAADLLDRWSVLSTQVATVS
ncbi:MAG: anthranilate phosphoribosyltransferase [Actinobacteria bacterium]|nr:anthranilate phosphoribosyltransferase [Actinomycetota bacterium]